MSELEILEMEHDMEEDPRYHLVSAKGLLDNVINKLWNSGNTDLKKEVELAAERVKLALKLLDKN